MLVTLANWYIATNLLLGVVAILAALFRAKSNSLGTRIKFKHQLTVIYAVSLAALFLPTVAGNLKASDFQPKVSAAEVWAAPTMKAWASAPALGRASIGLGKTAFPLSLDLTVALALLAMAMGAGTVLLKISRDARIVRHLISRSSSVRKYRSVRVLVSDEVTVPFSFWLPRRYYIVVPLTLVSRATDLVIAISHEAQHHRQHDTKALYFYQLLRAFFFWNPVAHFLAHAVLDLQEYVCDEALVGHRGVSAQAYGRCLLWVAESALHNHRPLVGTASMTSGNAKRSLKGRIQVMLTKPQNYLSRYTVGGIGAAAFVLMAALSMASTQTVHDRRVTLDDAEHMAEVARQDGSQFPIVVNELVLEQLNRFLGTPDGREYIKRSLARMDDYKALIGKDLAAYRLPVELMAVPVIESGYRNAPPSDNPNHCAGLWQFMPETARNFGLRVDDTTDDRLNAAIETDAAMRALAGLDLQFKDWGLALLAYNSGTGLVEKAIRETGSRDVWEITAKGFEGDPHYVASIMAAVLILKNQVALK